MEKQIYGNITNTARTQFQFDKIYPNKQAMDKACATDGIYAGRYVLVEYADKTLESFTRLIRRGQKFFFFDFPMVEATPTPVDAATLAIGTICYIENDNGSYTFYEVIETGMKYLFETSESPEAFQYNWNIDYERDKRGYDSTVWQKIYKDGKQQYIMIAELNTVVPNFEISTDAPEQEPVAPHFDEASTNLDYNLHMPAQWGFRVARAEDPNKSDIKTTHKYLYDTNGKLLDEPIEDSNIDADIYFNKKSFAPFDYNKVTVIDGGTVEKYEANKYYYKIHNIYKLDDREKNDISNFDELKYFTLKENSEVKEYYLNTDEFEEIDLLKTTETNWSTDYYIAASQSFAIITLPEYSANIDQYYRVDNTEFGNVIFTPINMTEEAYEPNKYYQLKYVYEKSTKYDEETIYYRELVRGEEKYYEVIPLVNKPEYEKNKYYTFFDTHLIKDASPVADANREYYKDPEGLERIHFNQVIYVPNVYYRKDENGEYILETSTNYPGDNLQLYARVATAAVDDDTNIINILPSGTSNRLYNAHIANRAISLQAAKDIQEIRIHLPAIGNAIAQVWNLIYGPADSRNDIIYTTQEYNSTMYDENGEKLYYDGLDTFVGALNHINDLIGRNIIKVDNISTINYNDGKISIDNKEISYLNIDNIERYIYYNKLDEKYYRIMSREDSNGGYDFYPIEMGQMNSELDSIYETLLEIQKALGVNESPELATMDSLKGALYKLQEIIEKQSKSFEFVTTDKSLEILKIKSWRHMDGTKLIRQWDNKYIQAAKAVEDYSKYSNYFAKKEEFILYIKTQVEATSENYKNYYIFKNEGYERPSNEDNFSEDISYYTFEKSNSTLDEFGGENVDIFCVRVLPTYWIIDIDGNFVSYPIDNIFTDIIEYYMYDISHTEPNQSNNNVTIKLLEENNRSKMLEILINDKGHVYSPKVDKTTSELNYNSFILPQAIVSENAPENVPIGTLWYDTNSI